MAHPDMAELLDLDAEVLHEYHREVLTWVAAQASGRARIVDLGAGTGTATLALARQLPDAELVAVDVDPAMLEHIERKARERGVAGRVRTVQADLDQPWPAIGPADLIWAANSLHHVADPGQALSRAFATLRPGGVLAVSEMGAFPRFLPDEAGAALEERCHAALDEARGEAGMHMHEDWAGRLAKAGFTAGEKRDFDIVVPPPLPAAGGRYAQASLQRWLHGLDGRLPAADLAELEAVAAAVRSRDDLTVRASRTVWLARRPAAAR
ncbi:MAG TPA: class I SAM-dependent methyltransferase [Streptosporangiaceae bacterium]|nr:class I SAM-dependent methyltransferase [Streptosporangiaceae bacterium]